MGISFRCKPSILQLFTLLILFNFIDIFDVLFILRKDYYIVMINIIL